MILLRNYKNVSDKNYSSKDLRNDLGISKSKNILLHLNSIKPDEGIHLIVSMINSLPSNFVCNFRSCNR